MKYGAKGIFMNVRLQKILVFITLLFSSLSMIATHYINNTGRAIIITNVTAQKSTKKSYFSSLKGYFHKHDHVKDETLKVVYFIELENDAQGDLDNNQEDEITITSKGMSDKRKLFPTNNAFNYVITLNKYSSKYEQFDINHAGQDETSKEQKDEKKQKIKNMKASSFAKATTDKKKLKQKQSN